MTPHAFTPDYVFDCLGYIVANSGSPAQTFAQLEALHVKTNAEYQRARNGRGEFLAAEWLEVNTAIQSAKQRTAYQPPKKQHAPNMLKRARKTRKLEMEKEERETGKKKPTVVSGIYQRPTNDIPADRTAAMVLRKS